MLALWAAVAVVLVAALVLACEGAEAADVGNKDITLYLHNSTTSRDIGDVVTFRVMNTTRGTDGLSTTAPTILATHNDWYLYPALANETTIQGRVTVYMWALRTVRMGDSTQATMIYELYDVDASGAKIARIARGITNVDMVNTWSQYIITNNSISNYTVAKGHSMLLEYEIQGSSSNWYRIAWGDFNYRSKIVIESQDYLMVDTVDILDHDGGPTNVLELDEPDKTVTFRADVTDPFGGYDVRFANVTLKGPTGRVLLDGLGMTKVDGYFTSYVTTFEYTWNYSGLPEGLYNLTVTSVDNSGFFYRFPAHPDDSEYGGHIEDLSFPFWIGGAPQVLNVTVLDNLTRPLAGAYVTISDRVGSTGSTGNVTLMVPNATYELTVYWQGVSVYNGSIDVVGATTIIVSAAVYDPAFVVLDDAGAPVEDAVALVGHPNGTVLGEFPRTDATGAFSLGHMAGGEYRLSLLWLGTQVYDGTVEIQANGPFQLDCHVHTLAIRVEDDLGIGLELAQVIVVNATTHVVIDSRLTGMDGNVTSRLPGGSYDLSVYWRSALVHDETVDHVVNASGTLVLLANIHTLTVTVVDTSDVPLAEAMLIVGAEGGSGLQCFDITTSEGTTSLRLPPGEYGLQAFWRDILVNTTSGLVVSSHADLVVVGAVHWVPMVVVDSSGVALSPATVAVVHSSGKSFGTAVTASEGEAVFRLPSGTYHAQVTWSDVLVFDDYVAVDSDDPVTLTAAVYYLEVHVTDILGLDLEGALISVGNIATGRLAGDGHTDTEGLLTFRLPLGDHWIDISWQDSPVLHQTVTVNATERVDLITAVFHAAFHTVDSRGADLEDAQVIVANASTDRAMGSISTDASGEASFRLPLGAYDVTVLWHDHKVLEALEVVESNDDHELGCSVHYVDLHVVDSTGIDLGNALVTLEADLNGRSMGSDATDAFGGATFKLPAGTFNTVITWRDVTVLVTSIDVDEDATFLLTTDVFYARLHTVDSRGVGLGNALVAIHLPGSFYLVGSLTSDPEGMATFRLPAGAYVATARWRDTEVLRTGIIVDDNEGQQLSARVHYVVFHAVDSDGLDLEEALVHARNGTTGASLGSGATDAAGSFELRLPQGDLAIDVSWMSVEVYAESGLTVTDDTTIPVSARVHHLTVEVRDSEGSAVAKVTVDVVRGNSTVASDITSATGGSVFRLPEGRYTVCITYRATQQLTFVHVRDSMEVDLNSTQTMRFDMADGEYPIPFLSTNLFLVVLGLAVLVAVFLLLLFILLGRAGTRSPGADGNEDTDGGSISLMDDDLLDLDLEDVDVPEGRGPLADQVDEAEIDLEER